MVGDLGERELKGEAMNPYLSHRRLGLGHIALAAIVLSLGQTATSQNPTAGTRIALSQYQDAAKTITFAQAYSRLAHASPAYHEPILTRGASGISVFRNASPAVVIICVGNVKNDQFDPTGMGTGVVINSLGDILTNWHVIEGYSAAVVFFKPTSSADISNSKVDVASVIAQSEISDLALLRLSKASSAIAPIPIGNIASVQVGEDIHVIGHPIGNPWSYSTGVVSQIRDGYAWTYDDGSKHQARVLQLQTAISPGNSGGPVLDDQGRLLGLIAMSNQQGQNLDYAVAADVIQSFLSSTRR
jgi:S1-C subfamily serine protease